MFKNAMNFVKRTEKFPRGLIVIETYSELLIDAGEIKAAFRFGAEDIGVARVETVGQVLAAALLVSAASDKCFLSFHFLRPSAIENSVEDVFVAKCWREAVLGFGA